MGVNGLTAGARRRAGRAKLHLNRRRRALARAWQTDDLDHLVSDPVFVLSPVRSGSTLLRVVLDTHSKICAPHELHLNTVKVITDRDYAQYAVRALGLSNEALANVLWDRILHRQLFNSGKRLVVDKTPQNVLMWQRIHDFWPDARYIHLRRHPGAIVDSLRRARPEVEVGRHIRRIEEYGSFMEQARAALPGPTVRYEDLTSDPEEATREICRYLDVRWERKMLDYGRKPRRGFPAGLGDWSDTIRTGRIQPARALPTPGATPQPLRGLAATWGYR